MCSRNAFLVVDAHLVLAEFAKTHFNVWVMYITVAPYTRLMAWSSIEFDVVIHLMVTLPDNAS